MGCGTFSTSSYRSYATSTGANYDVSTGRLVGQTYKAEHLDKNLNPKNFQFRECVNSEEHPNTIPVILALDVTGSMGEACNETAATLGILITNLYKKFQDIEFCIMGIGDLAYDTAPIQMSQFESDVRIAEALDKLYMEHGGGGNSFESYSAAWYMGLSHTHLDCWKQNRKGIIITMGDEPLNPYLPLTGLNHCLGNNNTIAQGDIETKELFKEASKKFDIFHIAVDSPNDMYFYYKDDIKKSFGQVLGNRFKIASIDNLPKVIEDCITESVQGVEITTPVVNPTNENGEISW